MEKLVAWFLLSGILNIRADKIFCIFCESGSRGVGKLDVVAVAKELNQFLVIKLFFQFATGGFQCRNFEAVVDITPENPIQFVHPLDGIGRFRMETVQCFQGDFMRRNQAGELILLIRWRMPIPAPATQVAIARINQSRCCLRCLGRSDIGAAMSLISSPSNPSGRMD